MPLRHRDAFGRVSWVGGKDASREHFIDPKDGRLTRLFVQGTISGREKSKDDDMFNDNNESNWIRTGPPKENISLIISLVYWIYSSVLVEGTERRRWDGPSTVILAAKWMPSCLLLTLMLLIPQNLEGEARNGGYFDPVHYRDWGYQKVPLNRSEARTETAPRTDGVTEESEPLLDGDSLEMSELEPHNHQKQSADADDSSSDEVDEDRLRGFGPQYLCFLQDGPDGEVAGYHTWKVSDWVQAHEGQGEADTDYVFISYTRKQFCVATDADLLHWDISDKLRRDYAQLSPVNRYALCWYGAKVARAAGKRAFWIDFECIRDIQGVAEANSQSYDVYRICDIVRAASSMAIVVGPPIETQLPGGTPQPYSNGAVTAWLKQWGTRLWTLPEILLCPSEHRTNIYAIGSSLPPEEIAKRNFVARAALPDASIVRQLIDHYESSIHLSPLELISLALQCFSVRQTDQFNQGDIAYALMGLLRRRPLVNRSDTGFEAFARLSLANNSDKLLERLLCVRTAKFDAPWHDTKDAWGMSLWDIEPHCQVAGIVDDQTVSLDGAYGAAIQWDSMGQVAFMKRSTMARTFAKIVLRGVPVYFIFGLAMTIAAAVIKSNADSANDQSENGSFDNSDFDTSAKITPVFTTLLVFGLVFLIPSLVIVLLSPVMLLNIYRGKFWSTQALFIGMEGIPDDLGSIERNLFGFNHGRLKWSAAGSALSRHTVSSHGECVALPPEKKYATATDDDIQDGARYFTLVDTYSMAATAFRAVRPPTTVMVCGQEGGMQRAILCSYDWKRAAFAREAVVRMNTTVLNRMIRVNRFRFALRRRTDADTGADGMPPTYEERSSTTGQHDMERKTGFGGEEKTFWPNLGLDLALIPCFWFVFGYEFGGFREDPYSQTIIRGCVTSAAAFILQIVNYKALFSIRIGHYLGMAVLIKGKL
ncbi:hypothetical protein Daus18300_002229 [Diaporthe australafricana]|uniref:3-hydroxyisobutyrate dehydrogenase protein n=1 Tax=Diaporthe australafricana TaxID=127596 RepID=A0ABR3XPG6_9PEZI